MEERIKKIMGKIFGIDVESINNESSPDTIRTWDSMLHMQLVIALEKEFNIEFSGEKISEIVQYPLIVKAIEELTSNR